MKDPLEISDHEARPPVVAIMGHIDHGKSTLLDFIRKTNKVEGEAGGITQHVAAYEVAHVGEEGRRFKITFLDTPGHASFGGIRARSALAADIAVLIVSAEDGVKPQTMDAHKNIMQENIPYIVAITKTDKPSANIDFCKQSLAENDIYVEGYGGNIPIVALSAKTGQGVNELLDMILLVSELENFQGDRGHWGSGIIIESKLDPKVGVVSTGIIKDGTVRRGMFAASPGAVATLRFIQNGDGEEVEALTFSSPILITGWDEMPAVGSSFETFQDKKSAQFYAESEAVKVKARMKKTETKVAEGMTFLPIIIKADVSGSLEAILGEIKKLGRERIVPKIVLSSIGNISENDVKSALTTPGTLIFGFHTQTDAQAAALAERSSISIENFDVIYKLIEKVEAILTEKEPRIEVEETNGTGKILKTFGATKDKQVVGMRAVSGTFTVGGLVKIVRKEAEIGRGRIRELQQNKIATDSVSEGNEFGAMIESKAELAPGDILEEIVKVTK